MKKKTTDLIGQRFGKLVVQERAGKTITKQLLWACICDCGGTRNVTTGKLISRLHPVDHCGCLRGQRQQAARRKGGQAYSKKRMKPKHSASQAIDEFLYRQAPPEEEMTNQPEIEIV